MADVLFLEVKVIYSKLDQIILTKNLLLIKITKNEKNNSIWPELFPKKLITAKTCIWAISVFEKHRKQSLIDRYILLLWKIRLRLNVLEYY